MRPGSVKGKEVCWTDWLICINIAAAFYNIDSYRSPLFGLKVIYFNSIESLLVHNKKNNSKYLEYIFAFKNTRKRKELS